MIIFSKIFYQLKYVVLTWLNKFVTWDRDWLYYAAAIWIKNVYNE